MPRSPATKGAKTESPDWYDSMPSISAGLSPASSMALRTAQVASARVVLPEPRMYSVSPIPTIAYLSRRYLGLVASISLGSGIKSPPCCAVLEHDPEKWVPVFGKDHAPSIT